jgi:N-acyl-D-aspartate/D-glutamate deacylase
MLDLLIKGGVVVDGTGGPARRADVGVRDGRIVVVGTTDEPAARTIDAEGQIVAPGFVDLHTHYDAQLSWDPWATPSCFHGVTTVLGGNCGFTVAPTSEEHSDYLLHLLARVEGMPEEALTAGLSWDWRSFGDWLDHLDGNLGVNAGFLVGHSTIRRNVMGEAAVGERATPNQIEAMAAVLHEAMRQGALGFSSSQAATHNDGDGSPVPSRAAGRDEMLALAATVAAHPGTTLEVILAGCLGQLSEAEVALMTDMSLAGDRPINWNVLTVSSKRPEAHGHQLQAWDVARAQGATVMALALPNLMQLWVTFLSGFALDGLPGWDTLFARPVPDRLRALRDPEERARLRAGAASPEAGVLGDLADWGRLRVGETFTPAHESLVGRELGEVAAERGVDPFDLMLDVVIDDELRTGLLPPPAGGDDDEAWRMRAEVWKDPRTVVGGSDAGAHLDLICGGIYSTHLLGDGVRERQLLSVEEAVHQLADVPARLYGLRDRGRIAVGWIADLVVFDPETVAPGPVHTRWDLPGGARRLYSEGIGVGHVVVGGTPIVADGELTDARPGRLLRSGRDTDTVTASGGRPNDTVTASGGRRSGTVTAPGGRRSDERTS